MSNKISYESGMKLIVLFGDDKQSSLKQEFLEIIKSEKRIEDIPDLYFEGFSTEIFSNITRNNFINCKSGEIYFPSKVCSLEEIKEVLKYLSKLYKDDKDIFEIAKDNWKYFIKNKKA